MIRFFIITILVLIIFHFDVYAQAEIKFRQNEVINAGNGLKNSAGVQIYTLEQCFNLALERNRAIKRAQNNIYSSLLDRKTAQFSLLPSVSYNSGHYFSFGKNIDPVTNDFVNESFSGGYTALGLQLQLFSGFSRLNAIKQSKYIIQSAEAAKQKALLELLTNVTLTYAKLLLNKENRSRNNGMGKLLFDSEG
jgi:outer membrane protein TolC